MNDFSLIRDWLFKGLSVEAQLDSLEADGLAVRAATDPGAAQRILPLEDFSPEIRRAAMQALPAYLAFFCIENAVRELVSERMKESKGSSWWDEAAVRLGRSLMGSSGLRVFRCRLATVLKAHDQEWKSQQKCDGVGQNNG